MGLARYVAGCVGLALVLCSVGVAASRVRRRVLPGWYGAEARLAEIIIGLSVLTVELELLGVLGQLRVLPLISLAVVSAFVSSHLGGTVRTPSPPSESSEDARRTWGTWVAFALVFVVGVQWLAHAKPVILGGFRDMDSLRYHGPFVAEWVQQHGLLRIHHTSGELQETFFPANSELLSTIGVLSFGRDFLTPFLNFGWFALGALAAWCAGSSGYRRVAALAGFAAIWSTPLLSSIDAGSAKNDIAAAALVLATAALLIRTHREGAPRTASLMIVGLCGGLAIGTKLSTLAAVGVLLAGAAILNHRQRRDIGALGAGLLVTGSFWYLRNLAWTGNPLPWIGHLGPVKLPAPQMPDAANAGWSVAHYAGRSWFWTQTVPGGLDRSFGPLWPVLIVGVAALAIYATVRRSSTPTLRVVAIASIAAGAMYLVTPYSAGGPEGHPTLFALDLRFLAPSLVLATAIPTGRVTARLMTAASAVLVIANQFAGRGRWGTPAAAAGGAGVLIAVLGAGAFMAWRCDAKVRFALVLAAGLAFAGAGWPLTNRMLEGRYARTDSGLTAAFAMFRDTAGVRIGVGGFADDYPFYGTRLQNHVQFIGVSQPRGGFRRPQTRDEWVRGMHAGDYDFVVVSKSPIARQILPREALWTSTDPSYRPVFERDVTRVFERVGGPRSLGRVGRRSSKVGAVADQPGVRSPLREAPAPPRTVTIQGPAGLPRRNEDPEAAHVDDLRPAGSDRG